MTPLIWRLVSTLLTVAPDLVRAIKGNDEADTRKQLRRVQERLEAEAMRELSKRRLKARKVRGG